MSRIAYLLLTLFALLFPSILPAQESTSPAYGEPVEESVLREYLSDRSSLTLVDARSEAEFEAFHIQGAVNVPLEQVDAKRAALPADRNAPILVYCVVGYRASLVAEALAVRGYSNVRVLPGEQLIYREDAVEFRLEQAP
jgi:rhodanese-related sulfurtransferase